MKIKVEYTYKEGYLPTPRCRKLRYRESRGEHEVEIREVQGKDFPVALYYEDFVMSLKIPARRWITLHWYDGQFWQISRSRSYFAGADWETTLPISDLSHLLRPRSFDVGAFPEQNDCIKAIDKYAKKWVVYNGYLYETIGEPMYNICTFGLGNNHAGIGTSLGVSTCYNHNLPSKWYFNALQRKEAIAAAKEVALRRGDTDSIEYIEHAENIQALMPECIQADPQSWDHPGDDWLNQLESITESAPDPLSAGLMAIMAVGKAKNQ